MNILAAVQQAVGEIGLAAPTALVGSADQGTIQLLALAQGSAASLAQEFDWQALQKQYSFNLQSYVGNGTTTLGSNIVILAATPTPLDTTYQVTGTGIFQSTYVVSQVGTTVTLSQPATASGTVSLTFGKTKYSIPADYARMINRTQYDKSRRWALAGPATAQEWEWLQSSYISTGPRIRYRIFGGYIQTWPVIATNDLISFEYVSNGYAIDFTTGAGKTSFTADTDTYVWPDRLMQLAVKWRYLNQRGFDSTSAFSEYEALYGIAKATDAGASTLSMGGSGSGSVLINIQNIPDSGYGLG
jgi:hypothetical protein